MKSFKKLFFRISRSSGLDMILFIVFILGIIFNWFSNEFYKIAVILLQLELLFLNANWKDPILIIRKETTDGTKDNESK